VGEEFAAGARESAVEREVRGILAPGLSGDDKRLGSKINDIDHLVSHVINGRDVFVTDDRGILRHAVSLRRAVGAVVMSPQECVDHLGEVERRRSERGPISAASFATKAGTTASDDFDPTLMKIADEIREGELGRSAAQRAKCDAALSVVRDLAHRIVKHLSGAYSVVQTNYGTIPGGCHTEVGFSRHDNPAISFLREIDAVVEDDQLVVSIDGAVVARVDAAYPDFGGDFEKTIRNNYLNGLQDLGERR